MCLFSRLFAVCVWKERWLLLFLLIYRVVVPRNDGTFQCTTITDKNSLLLLLGVAES